jgi:hypothetical protein
VRGAVHYAFVKKNAEGGGGSLLFDKKLNLLAKCFEE